MKRSGTLLAIVLLLAWIATAQTGAQTQTNAGASTNTNVNADKTGVKAQSDTSVSASQQSSAEPANDRKNRNSKSAPTGAERGNGYASEGGSGEASVSTGTTLNAVLTKSVDSRKAKEGDEVTAKTTADTKAEGQRTIPKGTKLIGHITKASARAKGDSDSSLGIIFDRAEVAKGREVPIHAVVQALAVARNNTSAMADDSMAGGMSGPPSGGAMGSSNAGGGLGGTVNGVGNTVNRTAGNVANTTGQAAGSAVGAAGSTVGNTGATLGGTANSTLSATSQGVVGLPGYTLDAAAANSTQGSVISSSGKNVKLDSGTQMVLRVVSQ